jgi:ParB-like chromosome segregation protein Spo0J
LELNPSNQRQSPLYKKVRDHINKTGYIINPLLVVEDKDKYKVVYGNNRYLSGIELGFTEFPIQVLKDDEVPTITEAAKSYKEINLDEI